MVFVFKIDHDVPMPPTREQLDDAEVLQVLTENPRISKKALAEKLGWLRKRGVAVGTPNRSRASRAVYRLRENGLVK